MKHARTSLEKKTQNINVENLIVVVIADGFYHNDGEAIIFDDCYVLLDTFIRPLIEEDKSKKRPCKTRLLSPFVYVSLVENFILMSFQPRNYYTLDAKYPKDLTDQGSKFWQNLDCKGEAKANFFSKKCRSERQNFFCGANSLRIRKLIKNSIKRILEP